MKNCHHLCYSFIRGHTEQTNSSMCVCVIVCALLYQDTFYNCVHFKAPDIFWKRGNCGSFSQLDDLGEVSVKDAPSDVFCLDLHKKQIFISFLILKQHLKQKVRSQRLLSVLFSCTELTGYVNPCESHLPPRLWNHQPPCQTLPTPCQQTRKSNKWTQLDANDNKALLKQ